MAVVLAALFINLALDIIATALNNKALHPELPESFKNIYNQTDYAKSQEYTKHQAKFSLATNVFNLNILLVFWFADGFNILDLYVRRYEFSSIVTGLIYISILVFCRTILAIPFSAYATFVIEEKFGFNKTTIKTFLLDAFKGLLLTALLGGILLAAILFIFENGGNYAWLYCWLAVSIILLFVQFIAPTWLMPIFNKFTPLPDGELKNAIIQFADSVSFSLEKIFIIDGSRRSDKSNAFFTGFGKHKRIALFDTLIEKHGTKELVAILAHEIGHYKKGHIRQGIVLSILHMGVMFYLLSLIIQHQGLFDAFFMDNTSVYAGLIFFGLLLAPIEMILSLVLHHISRKNEYEADRFASESVPDSNEMIRALKNLSKDNLSNLTPHPFYVFLNYSHPPALQRIQAIEELQKE